MDRNKVEPQPFVSICGVGNCGFGTIHWFRLFPVRKVASTKDSWNVYDYTLVVLSGADIVAPWAAAQVHRVVFLIVVGSSAGEEVIFTKRLWFERMSNDAINMLRLNWKCHAIHVILLIPFAPCVLAYKGPWERFDISQCSRWMGETLQLCVCAFAVALWVFHLTSIGQIMLMMLHVNSGGLLFECWYLSCIHWTALLLTRSCHCFRCSYSNPYTRVCTCFCKDLRCRQGFGILGTLNENQGWAERRNEKGVRLDMLKPWVHMKIQWVLKRLGLPSSISIGWSGFCDTSRVRRPGYCQVPSHSAASAHLSQHQGAESIVRQGPLEWMLALFELASPGINYVMVKYGVNSQRLE